MSQNPGSKPAISKVIGWVAGIVAFAVVYMLMHGVHTGSTSAPVTASAVLEDMRKDPDFGASMGVLEKYFPSDYAAFGQAVTDAANKHVSDAEARAVGYKFMRAFTARHMHDFMAAPDEDIALFMDENTKFIAQLQQDDVSACADFGMRSLSPQVKLSSSAQAMLGKMMFFQLAATHDGVEHPTVRPAPNGTDMAAFAGAVAKAGAPTALVMKMANPKTASTATPAEECEFSVYVYKALHAMPVRQAAVILGGILPSTPAAQP
jgi:hypothetical protein